MSFGKESIIFKVPKKSQTTALTEQGSNTFVI